MADRIELARLKITPCGMCQPVTVQTLKLFQQGKKCFIETTERSNQSRKCWQVNVPFSDVTQRLENLRKVTIPAFPVSPLVCDGEYVELTIHGEFSKLTLGWWTISPEGTEELSNFADWLQDLVFPDGDDIDEE